MKNSSELQALDLRHVWHPCSQMKDYEDFPMLTVRRAEGSILYTDEGPVVDAISSWWCKSLGHGEPRIRTALHRQIDQYEHIIAANTCSEPLTLLASALAELTPGLDRSFFADNGSTAIEVALKMALQYHAQSGHPEKTNVISLANGYHGETLLALGVSDCSLYSEMYKAWLPKIQKIHAIPYVHFPEDAEFQHMDDAQWKETEAFLDQEAHHLAAILFEPILQGSGYMKIYSADFLRRLRAWSKKNNVLLIADEIMTGFGRTGKYFACQHAGMLPDMMCMSKGLTGGTAPMSVVQTSTEIYNAFYDDYNAHKAFLHSNTFCGYAPAAAAALTVIDIMKTDHIPEKAVALSAKMRLEMEAIAKATGMLANIRSIGGMIAAEMVHPDTHAPFPPQDRFGFQVMKTAFREGALIRPLGNTLYWLPPLNVSDENLRILSDITLKSIKKTFNCSTNFTCK